MQESASISHQEDIDQRIGEAYEAAAFLTEFVVQAELNERGNFGMVLTTCGDLLNTAFQQTLPWEKIAPKLSSCAALLIFL